MYNFYFTQLNSATLSRVCVAKWVLLFSTFLFQALPTKTQNRVEWSFLFYFPLLLANQMPIYLYIDSFCMCCILWLL